MKSMILVGLIAILAPFAQADTYEAGTDRPGFDYKNFDLVSPRAIVCQWQCQKDKVRCKAWTYVKPGVQGPNPRCWLKFVVPKPVKSNCCVSGIIE